MVMKVDLNSDMGEGFGPWRMGDDAALLDVITSANIACGFHAGDPDVMAETMRLAAKNGVGIGAHPGFADLKGFGRRRLNIGAEELGNMIAYQLGAAEGSGQERGREHPPLQAARGVGQHVCGRRDTGKNMLQRGAPSEP